MNIVLRQEPGEPKEVEKLIRLGWAWQTTAKVSSGTTAEFGASSLDAHWQVMVDEILMTITFHVYLTPRSLSGPGTSHSSATSFLTGSSGHQTLSIYCLLLSFISDTCLLQIKGETVNTKE